MRALDSATPPYVSGHAGHGTIAAMAKPHICRCSPVAAKDIAARLGIPVDTVNKWRQRGAMPPERWNVAGASTWCWEQDIVPWLQAHPQRRELLPAEDS